MDEPDAIWPTKTPDEIMDELDAEEERGVTEQSYLNYPPSAPAPAAVQHYVQMPLADVEAMLAEMQTLRLLVEELARRLETLNLDART